MISDNVIRRYFKVFYIVLMEKPWSFSENPLDTPSRDAILIRKLNR